MADVKKEQPVISPNDPRMPLPARKGISRKLPAGLDRITIMMGFLFFVGIAWVLWETSVASPKKANAEGKDTAVMVQAGLMDMKLLAIDGNSEDESDKIVSAVYQDVKERQIPWAYLKANPFVSVGSEEYSEEVKDEKQSGVKTEKEAPKEVEIVAPPVDKMTLQSVLIRGDVASATISGVLVSKGQVIGGWRVVEIRPTQVVLQWRDQKHVLDMSQ